MIVVTGATGFIGRCLIRELVKHVSPREICCLVHKRSTPALERDGRAILKSLGIAMVDVDLMDRESLIHVPKAPDVIFHLAACTDTSVKDHSINDVGTRNLLEALSPKAKHTHFVYASSISVNDNRADYDHPIDESTATPERPCHEYGRKKLKTEHYLKQQAKDKDFALSIIRISAVFGAEARGIGLYGYLKELTKKQSLIARLNWPGKVGLISVEDMARFLFRVSQRTPKFGSFEFYIAATESPSIKHMFEIVHRGYAMTYRPVILPGWVWSCARFFAKRKRFFECVLPHKLYNRFWQFSFLVNNEYWNEPKKIPQIFPENDWIRFDDFYLNPQNLD